MSEIFYRWRLSNVPVEVEQEIIAECMAMGATGASEDLDFTQESDNYIPTTIEKNIKSFDVYFTLPISSENFHAFQKKWAPVRVKEYKETQKDWLLEWKKGFESFEVLPGHWVVPSWLEPPREARYVLRIDPGMAFGTGTHETTQIAARLLKMKAPKVERLLEVGTGTAILAILARQLGVRFIEATEIDSDAREVAKQNIQRNLVSDVTIHEQQIQDLTATFDMVLANIIDGVLVKLKDDLTAKTKPGGFLILSGILAEKDEEFLAHWRQNFQLLQTMQKGEWVGYLFKRREE